MPGIFKAGIFKNVQHQSRAIHSAGLKHYTGADLAGRQADNDNRAYRTGLDLASANIVQLSNAHHRIRYRHRAAPKGDRSALWGAPPGGSNRRPAGRLARLVACVWRASSPARHVFFSLALVSFLSLPHCAAAQSVSLDLGSNNGTPDPGETAKLVQIVVGIGIISLAPSLLVMMTAFTRIVIVLSILRNALGTQTTPPNMVLIGLALFLTYFVMQPTLQQAWQNGLLPMSNGTVDTITGLQAAALPFHGFMAANTRPDDIGLFLRLGNIPPPANATATPWRALVPAFAIGEMRRGFEMGFLIYLPFLIIDLVIASILMSLGMMMLPPTAVSLPFKLIFFVLVDGWQLVCGSLVQSFAPLH
jgi:flagellar biosynthetic protein FliP